MAKGKSLREVVTSDTVVAMLESGYGTNDIPAIRTISNDLMDSLQRDGFCTAAECNRLSQDVTIKEVQKRLRKHRNKAQERY